MHSLVAFAAFACLVYLSIIVHLPSADIVQLFFATLFDPFAKYPTSTSSPAAPSRLTLRLALALSSTSANRTEETGTIFPSSPSKVMPLASVGAV